MLMFALVYLDVLFGFQEGKALKLLATAARLDIEDFLQKKVYLEVLIDLLCNSQKFFMW